MYFFSVILVKAGYILLKGWFIMMGMTTGPAPALFVVGAARTKEHGGALIEDEVEAMMVPWQRRATPTSQPLRIYSLTLDLTLSVNNAGLSLIPPTWTETISTHAFPLRVYHLCSEWCRGSLFASFFSFVVAIPFLHARHLIAGSVPSLYLFLFLISSFLPPCHSRSHILH